MQNLPSSSEQRHPQGQHLSLARGNEMKFLRRTVKEVEMCSKGALFFCLSFLLLPSLAHKYWVRNQEEQNLISRMRSLGAL